MKPSTHFCTRSEFEKDSKKKQQEYAQQRLHWREIHPVVNVGSNQGIRALNLSVER